MRPQIPPTPHPPLELLLLDPLLVPHEDAGERCHHGRGMARAATQPAPQAAEEDAARAVRVEATVELSDLLRSPHAQARDEAALIGQQGQQAPAPQPRARRRRRHRARQPPREHVARRVPGAQERPWEGAAASTDSPSWPAPTSPCLSAATAWEVSPLRRWPGPAARGAPGPGP